MLTSIAVKRILKEFLDVCKMYLEYFDIFGIEKYQMRLSLHDKANLGKKYINQPDLWIKTEDQVRKALEEGELILLKFLEKLPFMVLRLMCRYGQP